ncbi:hypothetical protein B0T19DRAFT_403096 [Cercophora scortea]|uniref:Uncharacterized protein n=1 Tax=Cercophora scortea TaxID=314031 RepID=A0AAE0I8V8_9PEZI|nr:hypothetical protein B0T19DRAFT_403096 [Cercophora scortea]
MADNHTLADRELESFRYLFHRFLDEITASDSLSQTDRTLFIMSIVNEAISALRLGGVALKASLIEDHDGNAEWRQATVNHDDLKAQHNAETKALSTRVDDLKAKLASTRAQLAEAENNLNAEREAHEKQKEKLSQQCHDLQEKSQVSQKHCEAVKLQIKGLLTRNHGFEEMLKAKDYELNKAMKSLQFMDKKVKDALTVTEQIQRDSVSRETLASLEAEMAKLKTEHKQALQDCRSAHATELSEGKQTVFRDMIGQVRKLGNDISEKEMEVVHLNALVGGVEKEHAELQRTHKNLLTETQSLRGEKEALAVDRAALDAANKDATGKIERLKQQVERQKKELEAVRNRETQFMCRLRHTEGQLGSLRRQLAQAQEMCAEKHKQNQILNQELLWNEKEILTLSDLVASLGRDIQSHEAAMVAAEKEQEEREWDIVTEAEESNDIHPVFEI